MPSTRSLMRELQATGLVLAIVLVSHEQTLDKCVMERLQEAAKNGAIPMDNRTGHGAFFDRMLLECAEQPPKPHVEPNGGPAKER